MKILSDKPLYKYDPHTGNVERIENEYSDKHVIRYFYGDGKWKDVPIEKRITISFEEGDIFFESVNLAEKFRLSLAGVADINNISPTGPQTLLENFMEAGKRNEIIIQLSESVKIENGIYTLPYLDSMIPADSWLTDVVYLDENRNIKTIKKPNDDVDQYLCKYLRMHNLGKYKGSAERVFIEIHNEGGIVYLNHFAVQDTIEPTDMFYMTRTNHYLLFPNVMTANRFRRIEKAGAFTSDYLTSRIVSECLVTESIEAHEEKIKRLRDAGSVIVSYLQTHWMALLGTAIGFVAKIRAKNNPIPTDIDVGIPETEEVPNVVCLKDSDVA
jgi:hypothetical protein